MRQHNILCPSYKSRRLLQSRSQLTAEVESVLSELTHSLILLAKKTAEHSQKPQGAPTDLMAYSQQMLSRLSRQASCSAASTCSQSQAI